MFWDNFVKLCSKNDTSPNAVAKKLDISSGVITKWKQDSDALPNGNKLLLIADFFDVSIDYLLGRNEYVQTDLSDDEKELLAAYRSHPEMQSAVNRLLEISLEDNLVNDT